MSPRDFFAWVAEQAEKHEYYDGEVFAMAGGTAKHAKLSMDIGAELRAALRPQGCSTFSSDLRVQLTFDRRYVYPDATVSAANLSFWTTTV